MMDDLSWKHSKAPAVLVRRGADRHLGWQANEAALSWAREHEFDDSELDRLATDVGELGASHLDGALGHTPARHGEMHWHAVPWDNGWLAWCLPTSTFTPTPQERLDRLDILRHFGRIGMVGGAPEGMAWLDANACQLWGFDAQAQPPSPKQLLESVHPEDRARVVDLLDATASRAGYAHDRFRVCLKNGSVRHLHAMLKVVRGASERGAGLAGVIVDDTKTIEGYLAQRKVAEEALTALELAGVQAQTWEQRAELAATASGLGSWRLDSSSGEGEWDRQMFQIHGRDPQRGTPSWSTWLEQYVDASDRSEWSLRERFGPGAAPYRGRCRLLRGDGESRWVEITLKADVGPEARSWTALIGDITQRVASSELLRVEQQRARFAAEAAHLGVWECSTEGMMLYWSDQMYALLGIKSKLQHRSLREWWYALRPVSTRHQLERLIPLHAQRRDTLEHEVQVRGPDGNTRWLALRARVLPGPAGQQERVYGVCWDVTQRRLAEAESRKAELALADARAREGVTARLGHELRTSLQSMLGFSDLVATADVPAQVRDWLAKVHVAGDQLLHQIDTLASEGRAPEPEPDALALPEVTAQSLPRSGSKLLPLTLVCIEDNSLNLLLVENLVATRRHITLKSAADGKSGVEAVRELRPDLVLVDLRLPDISGHEVLRRIRSDPLLAATRCVALSADNAPAEIERALAAGFDDYWTKPIDTGQFLGGLDDLALGKPLPKVAVRRAASLPSPAPRNLADARPTQSPTGS